MKKLLRPSTALLLLLSAHTFAARAQSQGAAAHLTVYDAGVAEVLEERTVELQPGMNQVEYRNQDGSTRYRVVTKVEVVLTNRAALDTEAFVREGVEPYGDNQWTILEPSVPAERLAANTFQMKVRVPAGGKTTVTYTVETK